MKMKFVCCGIITFLKDSAHCDVERHLVNFYKPQVTVLPTETLMDQFSPTLKVNSSAAKVFRSVKDVPQDERLLQSSESITKNTFSNSFLMEGKKIKHTFE